MPASDPGEPWDDVTEQIYGPSRDMRLPLNKHMRGFWLNYAKQWGVGSTDDILATSTPHDLPVINGLARGFAVSDMWFASAPTQTNPNRAFSLGGSSLGRKNNGSFNGIPYTDLRTIFTVFNEQGVSAKLYADHYWMVESRQYFTQYMFPLGMTSANIGGSIAKFQEAVASDSLAAFTYLEPTFFGEVTPTFGTDYHPPGSLYQGEKFLRRIYDTLRAHPAVFNKTLFIVTFDEHGGTYDHITPPTNAPVPDTQSHEFSRYGLRVPTLLITPWVAPGTVFRGPWYPAGPRNDLPFDHTSVLATLMKWKNIPYTRPTDAGWLRARTAVAPTFENVIGNQKTTSWPSVHLYECSIAEGATLGQTGIPRTAITVGISRITNLPPDDPEHQRIAAGIESRVVSEEHLAVEFRKLIREYGDRPRAEGVRTS
jgi:phospholipase C